MSASGRRKSKRDADAERARERRARQTAALMERRAEAERKAAVVAEIAAAAEEVRAESVAPAVQRRPVTTADGSVMRGARVEPDGLAFRVSSPIRNMVARGEGRDGGNVPMIRREHQVAAERLAVAWEEGGKGVGMGASKYGERTSGGATPGVLSDVVIMAIGRQARQREEFQRARQYLGTLWPIVHDVALLGVDVATVATRERRDRNAVMGYLAAALDRLVEFYAGLKREAA